MLGNSSRRVRSAAQAAASAITTPMGVTYAASFPLGAAAGTLVAQVSGLAVNESITIAPNDGRLVTTSDNTVVVGPTATGLGAAFFTITSNLGKTWRLAVIVSAATTSRVAVISAQVNSLPPGPIPQTLWDQHAAELYDPESHPHMGAMTHTAVKDGLWSDPTTWGAVAGNNAAVPGHPSDTITDRTTVNVNVSSYKVTYDLYQADKTKAINGIHVSGTGTLALSRTTETRLFVDTIMVHGTTDFGQWNSPIPESATPGKAFAEIVFLPQQAPGVTTRLGLMTMGPVRLHGAQKASRLTASDQIGAGAQLITLQDLSTANWRVGDQVLFLATEDAGANSTDPQYAPRPTSYWGVSGTVTQTLGFKKSQDEVRTIAAISATQITLDAPLTYAHKRYQDTLPRGESVDLKPVVAMLTYSVRMRSADASEGNDITVLQNRAHSMFMHSDDVDARYAEARNMARTDTCPNLTTDQQYFAAMPSTDAEIKRYDFVLMTAQPGTAGAALMSDPLNVRGRYAWHLHGNGALFSRRNCVFKGLSAWAPTGQHPQPGWAITQHNARALIEECNTYNTRGAGIVSENGNEIGQWLNNISAWNRGDGFKLTWQGRHERIQNHNGSSGVGYENQSRQILQQGNICTSSHYSWSFLQQATHAVPGETIYGTTTPSSTTLLKRIPDEFSLRLRDPLASGQAKAFLDNGVENSLTANTYGIEQSQIPDFSDNHSFGCMTPVFVAHRPSTQREDTTPMIARRNHAINCRNFFHLEEYSFYYSFYDTLCIGLSKTPQMGAAPYDSVEAVNWAISLGTVSWQFNFANFRFRNFAAMVVDQGIGVNYNGYFIDCDATDVTTPFSYAVKKMAIDPATHPHLHCNGTWTWTGPVGGSYDVNMAGVSWQIYNSSTQLPLDVKAVNYPQGQTGIAVMPTAMQTAYNAHIAAGGKRPFVWIDPASILSAPPTLSNPTAGAGQLDIFGYIADSVGLRRWPDHQIVDAAKVHPVNDVVRDHRTNRYLDMSHLIRRNGCYTPDGGATWKMPMWFTEHDRGTGEYIQFRVDATLNLTSVTTIEGVAKNTFLALYTVDPTVKPQAPLLPEEIAAPSAFVIPTTTPVVVTSDFTFAENAAVDMILQAALISHPKWSIDTVIDAANADAAKFVITGNKLSLAAKDYEAPDDADANRVYKLRLVVKDEYGNTASKAINGTLTNILEAVTSFTDTFDGTLNQKLTAREGWTLVSNGESDRMWLDVVAGNTIVKNDTTAPASSTKPCVYLGPDFGSSDMFVEGTVITAPGQVVLAARIVYDAASQVTSYIGLVWHNGTLNGEAQPLRVVQRRMDWAEDTLASYGPKSSATFGNKKIRLEVIGDTFKVYVDGSTVPLTPSSGFEALRPDSPRSNIAGFVQNRNNSSGSSGYSDFSAGKLTAANALTPITSAPGVDNVVLIDTSPWVGQGVQPTGDTSLANRRGALSVEAVATGTPQPALSFQWQVDTGGAGTGWGNVPGSDGTSRNYVPQASDQGRRLRCAVTPAGGATVFTPMSNPVAAKAIPTLGAPYTTDFSEADEFLECKNGWGLPPYPGVGQPRSWRVGATAGKLSCVNAASNQTQSIDGPDIGQTSGFVQAVLSVSDTSHYVRMRSGGGISPAVGSWIGFRRNGTAGATADSTIQVFSSPSATPASITSLFTGPACPVGTVIRLETVGNALRLYYDGVKQTPATDPTFSTTGFLGTRTGVDGAQTQATVANWLDSFSCGPISAFLA